MHLNYYTANIVSKENVWDNCLCNADDKIGYTRGVLQGAHRHVASFHDDLVTSIVACNESQEPGVKSP